MKFLQAVSLIAVIIFVSCTKSSTPPPPAKGTLIFTNNSVNPYQVFVNGKSAISMQPGKTVQSIKYTAGEINIKVVQLEGYILYPTEKTFAGTLKENGSLSTTYP